MFNQMKSFVNDKINKSNNRNRHHNFYIYLGNTITDTILDINISKEQFVKNLNILSNYNLKESSFSKEKVYHINNLQYPRILKKLIFFYYQLCQVPCLIFLQTY